MKVLYLIYYFDHDKQMFNYTLQDGTYAAAKQLRRSMALDPNLSDISDILLVSEDIVTLGDGYWYLDKEYITKYHNEWLEVIPDYVF